MRSGTRTFRHRKGWSASGSCARPARDLPQPGWLRPLTLALALALCFAGGWGCGGDPKDEPTVTEEPEPVVPSSPRPIPHRGGPLALAGPDQRALPGMRVVLDARGSVPPEDGRAFSRLWVQEAGPRVSLDDPTAAVATFIAPQRQAQASDRLLFRLILDDGLQRSHDRVAVELVDEPTQILPAPVALGGADQEVRPGSLVTLAVPAGEQPTWATPVFLDPACLLEGGSPECAEVRLPHCWSQVEGSPVLLEDPCGDSPSFLAPDREDILTFRLDAHRDDGTDRALLCGPDADLDADRPACAAADYVRIFVRRSAWRTLPPTGKINYPDDLPRVDSIMRVERSAAAYPSQVRLSATAADPISQQLNTFYGFRPLVGMTPPGELINFEVVLSRDPAWPRMVAVVFESQFRRLRAAPAPAILAWLPPSDRPPLHADAGDPPCSASSIEWCAPPVAGELLSLEGSAPGSASPTTIHYCWEQIAGPPVALDPPEPCVVGLGSRSFVAPSPGPGISHLDLSFQLVVRDQGPFSSSPDVVAVRIQGDDPPPPVVAVATPLEARAGAGALLDASRSGSPADLPLTVRWRQVRSPNTPRVDLRRATDCYDPEAPGGACMRLIAPLEAVGSTIELEVLATDSNLLTSTRRVHLPVVE